MATKKVSLFNAFNILGVLVCICRDMESSRTPLSEAEFEEIMNRNRAISSSAISRAVSDASAGKAHNSGIHAHTSTGVLRFYASEKIGSHMKLNATLCSL